MEYTDIIINLDTTTTGTLHWDKRAKQSLFTFDKNFLEKNIDIAPINMSIHAPRTKQGLSWSGWHEKIYRGLPPLIADSLPDYYGNLIYNTYLQVNQISKSHKSPMNQLLSLRDLSIGAQVFNADSDQQLSPINKESIPIDLLYLHTLLDDIQHHKKSEIFSITNQDTWSLLLNTASIAGGKQPKSC